MISVKINSEFAKLKSVLIHEPGAEVENMTPATAERALYSDILNLPVARQEYYQFKGVLESVCEVINVKDLIKESIGDSVVRAKIIESLVQYSGVKYLAEELNAFNNENFATALIEGVKLPQKSLSNFLSRNKYAINPLHNIFFTRDASFSIGNNIYMGAMARTVRKPESLILETLYGHHLSERGKVVPLNADGNKKISIEGGDVLIVSENTLLVGIGSRTTPDAIDKLVEEVSKYQELEYVLVQELPDSPESFIHLDMIFTLLSANECMVYRPVIIDNPGYHSLLMEIENGVIKKIRYTPNLLQGLKQCGLDYRPIFCGDGNELWQEREQWHSGANFFAFEPSKIIGYSRNNHTAEALNKEGFEIISADDVIKKKVNTNAYKKCLVTIQGAELARGGGGARCMTMPLLRE